MKEKKPHDIVWNEEDGYNQSQLTYGSNVSAPAIKVEDVSTWKNRGVQKVNKQLNSKFNELKEEYNKLIEEFQWNDLVYRSNFSFEPVIGETYHLYIGKDGNLFLSLIGPEEWNREHMGTFKLNSEQKWVKQN